MELLESSWEKIAADEKSLNRLLTFAVLFIVIGQAVPLAFLAGFEPKKGFTNELAVVFLCENGYCEFKGLKA